MSAYRPRVSESTELRTSTQELFAIADPDRINPDLVLRITDHTYLPRAASPRRDWVASVALPAFHAYAMRRDRAPVRSFATVGTGAGTDALAAVETLAPSAVFLTDLHRDVVDHAVANVRQNLRPGVTCQVAGAAGYLADPLRDQAGGLDLIYENLPNIPLSAEIDIDEGQASSTFLDSTLVGSVPEIARRHLLELHCALLRQAKTLLTPGGSVLCSIGARIPLAVIEQAVADTGYIPDILTYTWKIQSEAEDVINGYVRLEAEGAGPFHFYPAETLDEVFSKTTPHEAAAKAMEIEAELADTAIDVQLAAKLAADGRPVGHTVAVVQATRTPDA